MSINMTPRLKAAIEAAIAEMEKNGLDEMAISGGHGMIVVKDGTDSSVKRKTPGNVLHEVKKETGRYLVCNG